MNIMKEKYLKDQVKETQLIAVVSGLICLLAIGMLVTGIVFFNTGDCHKEVIEHFKFFGDHTYTNKVLTSKGKWAWFLTIVGALSSIPLVCWFVNKVQDIQATKEYVVRVIDEDEAKSQTNHKTASLSSVSNTPEKSGFVRKREADNGL